MFVVILVISSVVSRVVMASGVLRGMQFVCCGVWVMVVVFVVSSMWLGGGSVAYFVG